MKKKKVYSVQTELLAITIAAVLAITLLVGGLAIVEIDAYVQRSAGEMTQLTAQNESEKINGIFDGMEKSVYIMETYAMGFIHTQEDVTSRQVQSQIVEASRDMFSRVAENTDGAVAYYLRFDPAISDYVSGFFYSKLPGESRFYSLKATDLSLYDRDDTERVGWFWQPYEKQTPIWMEPYYNQNNNIYMISYVIPMYYNGRFVGVVGMDFDYTVLTDMVDEIRLYEHGFAHLEQRGTIAHHPTLEVGTDGNEGVEGYIRESCRLKNGMELVVSASREDVRQIKSSLAAQIVLVTVLFVVCVAAALAVLVRRFVGPLKKLTEAAEKLGERNYDFEVIHGRTKEIELLSGAFVRMAALLREHDRLQYLIAYRDSLTGLRNTTSYKAWVEDFDRSVGQEGAADLGVVVLDINYLKETNDKYGHDAGNKLIVAVAQLISGVFKRSPVFRIGGDEFLVILQNRDLPEYKVQLAQLEELFSTQYIELEGERVPVSAACGVALYRAGEDTCFLDVFNRADDDMYRNKRKMKTAPGLLRTR